MNLAEILRYDINDYRQWEGDWELIDGFPVAMAPSPFGPHQGILSEIVSILNSSLKRCKSDCFVYAELDYIIDDFNVVRPDVAVVCKKVIDYIRQAPELIVEIVSKSSIKRDNLIKFNIYEKEGVKNYCIISLSSKSVVLYKLKDGKFVKEDSTKIKLDNCEIDLNLNDIWRYL
jgi:Uma2 family endonuclease